MPEQSTLNKAAFATLLSAVKKTQSNRYALAGRFMKWDQYRNKFVLSARAQGFDAESILLCLDYARGLHDNKLPVIYDINHFSQLVGYNQCLLNAITHSPRHFYRTFYIPKRNGQKRCISEPLPTLKLIQQWILKNILEKVHTSPYAKAYVRHKSIKDNAYYHLAQGQVLALDIANFFGSISDKSVFLIFRTCGYTTEVAGFLSNLCCLNNRLPQGAPTSPALSNIFMNDADARIVKYTIESKIRYTRYADDLAFSGHFSVGNLIAFIKSVLTTKGLRLNCSKTKLMKPHKRQEVTGVVVNQKMQVQRSLRRNIRQTMFYIKRFGLDSHMEKIKEKRAHYLEHLLGQVNFAIFINPSDTEMKIYYDELVGMIKPKEA